MDRRGRADRPRLARAVPPRRAGIGTDYDARARRFVVSRHTRRRRSTTRPRPRRCRKVTRTSDPRGDVGRIRGEATGGWTVTPNGRATRRDRRARRSARRPAAAPPAAATRPGPGSAGRRPAPADALRLADVGPEPEPDVRLPVRHRALAGHRRQTSSSAGSSTPTTSSPPRRPWSTTPLYVGDWSGRFYALDAATGSPRWTIQADIHPEVYAGQIVSSAAVEPTSAASAPSSSAAVRRCTRCGPTTARCAGRTRSAPATPDDFTEIESSPVVVDGKVVFGIDVHNHEGTGRRASSRSTPPPASRSGSSTPSRAKAPSGCVDVWGSPSVDLDRGLAVYFGTGSASTARAVDPYSEAIVAVDLGTGKPKWTYQPHGPNVDDLDFAGAPNLFDGRRPTTWSASATRTAPTTPSTATPAQLVWKTKASGPLDSLGLSPAGSSARRPTPTASSPAAPRSGPARTSTAIDATDGKHPLAEQRGAGHLRGQRRCQRRAVHRRQRLHLPRLRPPHRRRPVVRTTMKGVGGRRRGRRRRRRLRRGRHPRAGARQAVRDQRRLPLRARPTRARRADRPRPRRPPRRPHRGSSDLALDQPQPARSPCIGSPCPCHSPSSPCRPGSRPSGRSRSRPTRSASTIHASPGSASPSSGSTAGSPAAGEGATVFGLFISESDDNPVGGLLCILDAVGTCTGRLAAPAGHLQPHHAARPEGRPRRSRPPSDGLARLITTISFDPPLDPRALNG